MQETFVVAWRRRRDLRIVGSSALPWLLTTARFVAMNTNRQRRAHRVDELDEHSGADEAWFPPVSHDEAVQQLRWVRAEIAGLDSPDRELCELCLLQDRSYDEAAAMLGLFPRQRAQAHPTIPRPTPFEPCGAGDGADVMITLPRPEGPALDDAVAPIRREVLARTVGHRRTRSRWTLGVVGSVAAVTALATVLVAGDLTGTTEHVPVVGSAPQAATAAEVFRRAADATVHTSDPVVGPGQYLEVDVQEQSQAFLGPDISALVPYSLTVYRPADTSAEWTLVRTSGEPVAYFPSDRAAEVEAAWKADPAGYPTGTVRALDGAFSGDPWTPADLAAMPRDPDALYDWVAAHASGSNSHEEAMTVLVTDRLATGMGAGGPPQRHVPGAREDPRGDRHPRRRHARRPHGRRHRTHRSRTRGRVHRGRRRPDHGRLHRDALHRRQGHPRLPRGDGAGLEVGDDLGGRHRTVRGPRDGRQARGGAATRLPSVRWSAQYSMRPVRSWNSPVGPSGPIRASATVASVPVTEVEPRET